MINKIINLLEENTSIRQLTCGEILELIDRDSFYELAQEIEKLFAIPVVSKAERDLFVDMIEKMNELDWEECDNGFAARVFDRLNGNK